MTGWHGVALVPCADHIDAVMSLQRQVSAGTSLEPVLDSQGNLPHVTIYQGPILDSANPQKILSSLKTKTGLKSIIHVTSTEIFHQPTGWIFLGLQKTAILNQLQSMTMAIVSDYIDQLAIDKNADVSQYAETERRNYLQYGYRYAGDAFMPHITLGRTNEDLAKEKVSLAAQSGLGKGNWIFDRLTFYEMGEHGAHASVLAEEWLR